MGILSYWFRHWLFHVCLPCILVCIGNIADTLGFSSKALHYHDIQKARKRNPPSKWDGISHAYDRNTLQLVEWTRPIPIFPSYVMSYGKFTTHPTVFYEHRMNNGLHIVTTESSSVFTGNNVYLSTTPIYTVEYAHVAAYESTQSESETYKSGDLSNFFNERSWTFHTNGLSVDLIVASAAVHGLVNVKNLDLDVDLRVFVMLEDFSEHTFRIGDVVQLQNV